MEQDRHSLYHDTVVDPAEEISQGILLDTSARDDLRALGLNPNAVLDSIRQNACDMVKDLLRPAFYQRVEDLGVWR